MEDNNILPILTFDIFVDVLDPIEKQPKGLSFKVYYSTKTLRVEYNYSTY